MSALLFEGRVFSGRGEGKLFVCLPWVKRQIEEKLGFSPFAGTLNIRLTPQSAKQRRRLDGEEGLVVAPEAGFFLGVLFRAQMQGVDCAVVLPKTPTYPSDVLEIIASVCLREELELVDGSHVAVLVTV